MLSLPHLVVIFIVALMIFGPEKLPELARMLGKATAEFRRMTSEFRYVLEHEVQDLDRQARIHDEEVRAALPQIQRIQPEGTMPRSPSVGEADNPLEAAEPLHPAPNPTTEAAASPPEKLPDDNVAG